MAWIEIIDESVATGELKSVYDEITRSRGKLSNIMRIHSLRPDSMQAHLELYLKLMFSRSGLSRAERELLAVVVSSTNDCDYCIRHHAEALNAYWKDDQRVEAVVQDYGRVDLTGRERAMLDYAVLLTERPSAITEDRIQTLRDAGFSDRDILDINLIASYFNFVNRIAEGLGVTFSAEEAAGYRY